MKTGFHRLLETLRPKLDLSYKYRRFYELFFGVEALLCIGIGVNFTVPAAERNNNAIIIFAMLMVAIVTLHARFLAGHQESSIKAGLWLVTVMVSMVCWTGQGLHDTSMIANGLILVYAGMMETRRQYLAILAAMIASIIGMGIASKAGYVTYQTDFPIAEYCSVSMMFALLGYSVGALAQDLRQMVDRYRDENEKVRQSEAEISRMVNRDAMTGLVNRTIVEREFKALAEKPGSAASLFFIDLDNFKTVNDTLGHGAGDDLLKAIANRLKSGAPAGSIICRNGGDEFLVLSAAKDKREAASIAAGIQAAVCLPVDLEGTSLIPTFSMGIACMPEEGSDFETIKRKADIALYSAKAGGRNIFRIYDDSMNASALAHLSLAEKLRTALSGNEFQLFYQPRISLASGRIEGAEALLRWFPKSGETYTPDQFIPVAESTGSIVEIGKWALKEACRQCRSWQLQGLEYMKISVNISAVQFRRGNLGQVVAEALQEAGLEPRFLELEFSETLLFELETEVADQMRRLSETGVTLSVNDFAKGYADFAGENRLNIATVKIDRHLVAEMSASGKGRDMSEAIIQMARSMDLSIIAKGVENEEVRDRLHALGCSGAQGHLWAKPLNNLDFAAFAGLRSVTPVSSMPLSA